MCILVLPVHTPQVKPTTNKRHTSLSFYINIRLPKFNNNLLGRVEKIKEACC